MVRSKRLLPATTEKPNGRRLSNADRSSYFARREATKVLRNVLQGDERRKAVASIKSLVFSPSVRNKKATFALVCQTLKHLQIIKEVLVAAKILNGKWKRQEELMYIITYDILFGQATTLVGDAENFLLLQKEALQSALAQLLVRKKVKRIGDLLFHQTPDVSKPRYVRVNTLKLDVESALLKLGKEHVAKKDDIVPDLLMLPPGTDLHDHPLVMNGSVFLQGKASSMVAVALGPEPGWEVLDACSAPGNKTVHLAALMRGKGKIIACELNKERVNRLEETIKQSGANNVEVLHGDFLNLDIKHPSYSKVRAILLDPSCSGSGTAAERLDHLLPSYSTGHPAGVGDTERVKKLAAFQRRALAHALSFPAAERVVYSTCSIHQTENEDVVKSVLPLAATHGFQLATPFPQWPRRGLPVFEGSEHLLRTDPVEDMEGFFIALFVRKSAIKSLAKPTRTENSCSSDLKRESRVRSPLHLKNKTITKSKILMPSLFAKMSKTMLYPRINQRRKFRISPKSNDDSKSLRWGSDEIVL